MSSRIRDPEQPAVNWTDWLDVVFFSFFTHGPTESIAIKDAMRHTQHMNIRP